MSKVVSMFAWGKAKKTDTVVIEDQEEIIEDKNDFAKTMELNAKNKKRVEEERKQHNKNLARSLRLKGR